jgi:hypothetical protein
LFVVVPIVLIVVSILFSVGWLKLYLLVVVPLFCLLFPLRGAMDAGLLATAFEERISQRTRGGAHNNNKNKNNNNNDNQTTVIGLLLQSSLVWLMFFCEMWLLLPITRLLVFIATV